MDNDAADGSDRGVSDGRTGDEAAWRDLVARLVQPAAADAGQPPWPDTEDVPPADADLPKRLDDRSRIIRPASSGPDAAGLAYPARFRESDCTDGAHPGGDPRSWFASDAADGDDDEYYARPPAPPLPRLEPVTKGAWLALFGGPGYLFLATMLGWEVAGWAAFAAIAAFVTGFVILVIRLGDGPSRRDDPDQGAVL